MSAVATLQQIVARLDQLSILTVIVTFTNFLVAFVLPVVMAGFLPSTQYSQSLRAGSLLLVFLPIVAVVLLLLHDRTTNRGEALFEELSDELHWFAGTKAADVPAYDAPKPLLSARVALRGFIRATTLPFAPAQWGTTVYLALNLIPLLFLASRLWAR
jgi:hypothetical protein